MMIEAMAMDASAKEAPATKVFRSVIAAKCARPRRPATSPSRAAPALGTRMSQPPARRRQGAGRHIRQVTRGEAA